MRAARVELSLAALNHNLKCIRRVAPGRCIMAMVKANGYGHGLETVAATLYNADAFGVACLEEAIRLRDAGIQKRIVLMEGFFERDELGLIAELGLDVVVHQFSQIAILEQQLLPTPLCVWLKVDTGMRRLGFLPAEVAAAWERLHRCPTVAKVDCIMTHFAEADDIDKKTTLQQLNQFIQTTSQFPGKRSLANSAAILAWPETHADWVRPGIMLYGVSPFMDSIGSDHGLKPVMTMVSELIAIRQVSKGDAIGYGGQWVCPEDMPIGVVAIGYGDGYPRHAKNGTPILVNDTLVPLIGRVSMDMLTVDLRRCPQAKIGDRTVLWGDGLPIEEVAKSASTVAYELLCGVAPRLKIIKKDVQWDQVLSI